MIVESIVAIVIGGVLGIVAIELRKRRRGRPTDDFSPSGSVEVDCRSCGQFNRVPHDRLRDRPKCGRCKARLMPGRRLVVCYVSPLDGPLRTELNAVWEDEDRLWQSLADHVSRKAKMQREARDPSLRVVN